MSTIAVVLIIVIICLLVWWLYSMSRSSSTNINSVTPITPATTPVDQNPEACVEKTITLCQLFNQILFNEKLLLITYLTKQADPNYQTIRDSARQKYIDSVASFTEFLKINYPRAAFTDFTERMRTQTRPVYPRIYALYDSAIAGNEQGVQQATLDIKNIASEIISGIEQQLDIQIKGLFNTFLELYVADIKAILSGDWAADAEYSANMSDIAYNILSKVMFVKSVNNSEQ